MNNWSIITRMMWNWYNTWFSSFHYFTILLFTEYECLIQMKLFFLFLHQNNKMQHKPLRLAICILFLFFLNLWWILMIFSLDCKKDHMKKIGCVLFAFGVKRISVLETCNSDQWWSELGCTLDNRDRRVWNDR